MIRSGLFRRTVCHRVSSRAFSRFSSGAVPVSYTHLDVYKRQIVGYNYGARNFLRVKKAYLLAAGCATIVAAVGFVLFQFFPQSIIDLFGSEDALYNEFAQKSFRIFLLLCILTGFQTVTGIFFQSIGKPVKAAVVTLSRQILVLVPATLLLPLALGLDGVLWAGPVADGVSFLIALFLALFEMRRLTRRYAGEQEAALCTEQG